MSKFFEICVIISFFIGYEFNKMICFFGIEWFNVYVVLLVLVFIEREKEEYKRR